MMPTVLNPTTPRLFTVEEDEGEGEPETVTAPDYLAAFKMYWRLNGGDSGPLKVELGGGATATMHVWVGSRLFKVRDITDYPTIP